MTTLTRHRDWPLHLEAFMAQRRATPFAWGTNDCCTFVVDAVQAITGVDVATPALRAHRTEAQAIATLTAGGGVRAIATAAFGVPINANRATVGDVLLVRVVDTAGQPQNALGLCNGDVAMLPSAQGLVAVGRADALCCWRIG